MLLDHCVDFGSKFISATMVSSRRAGVGRSEKVDRPIPISPHPSAMETPRAGNDGCIHASRPWCVFQSLL